MCSLLQRHDLTQTHVSNSFPCSLNDCTAILWECKYAQFVQDATDGPHVALKSVRLIFADLAVKIGLDCRPLQKQNKFQRI